MCLRSQLQKLIWSSVATRYTGFSLRSASMTQRESHVGSPRTVLDVQKCSSLLTGQHATVDIEKRLFGLRSQISVANTSKFGNREKPTMLF